MRPKRVTYDADTGVVIRLGDLLVSTRTTYVVLDARKMKSKYPNRWALGVAPIGEVEGGKYPVCTPAPGRQSHQLRWYPRKRKTRC